MAARRATTKAEADIAAQLPAWHQTYGSITELSKYSDIPDAVERTNKCMKQFQMEYQNPDQTAAELRSAKSNIKNALLDLRQKTQAEIEACNKTLALLSNLIALKSGQEAALAPIATDRPKRLRESSAAPSSMGSTGTSATGGAPSAANGGLTLVIPLRPGVTATMSQQLIDRAKKQLPLHPGRKVAFRVPNGTDKGGKASFTPPGAEGGTAYEEAAWILATIKKEEKGNRYVVQDVEGEEGQEPPVYTTTLRSLIPLPRVDVPASDPSHLNHYPEYRAGSTVLALFPDTTSFYKAEVISTPKDMQTAGQRTAPSATKAAPSYKVRFEDDQGELRLVSAEEVIDFPGY